MGKEVLNARTMQLGNYRYITIHMNDVDNLFGARARVVVVVRLYRYRSVLVIRNLHGARIS